MRTTLHARLLRVSGLALATGLLALAGVGPGCGSWRNEEPLDSQGGASKTCGDRSCGSAETCASCPQDCGACSDSTARCGDSRCSTGETCSSCPGDCGACPAGCGDETCSPSESCSTCPGDCGPCAPVEGACGDQVCAYNESCRTCAADCGGACPAPCPTSGAFSLETLAIRDNASNQYLIGIRGNTPAGTGPITVSGIKLVDGTVLQNFVLIASPRTSFEGFFFLPGKPACTMTAMTLTHGNCMCDFPVIVSNGQTRCTIDRNENCTFCGNRSPEDHDGDEVRCSALPPP